MKKIIKSLLHIPYEEKEFLEIDILPLYLKGSYQYTILCIYDIDFVIASPIEKINFSTMKKHRAKLMEIVKKECAFHFRSITSYVKKKMIEENIPFIIEDKEVYLPFLAIAISEKNKERKQVSKISFLTQKMLLAILYKDIKNIGVTEMADVLGVSKMSVSRCFNEVEALYSSLIIDNGTSGRYINWNKSKAELWKTIKPFLRNPIKKEFLLDCEPQKKLSMSGISAISHYSMLDDNSYRTFAVTKEMYDKIDIKTLPQVPTGEIPHTLVQELGYIYYLNKDKTVIDPISAILSVGDTERNDMRIQMAIEEILKEFIYERA